MAASLVSAKELAAKREPRFTSESSDYARAREALGRGDRGASPSRSARATESGAPQGPEMPDSWKFVGMNGGEVGLAEMFGVRDTLVLYHWMFGPERNRPCPDVHETFSGRSPHNAADLQQRLALAVVSRSKVERMIAFGVERSWRDPAVL